MAYDACLYSASGGSLPIFFRYANNSRFDSGPLMRPASHSSTVLPFMERLLGFCGESAEDDVLDGFIGRKFYVFDDKLLFDNSKDNGDELSLVRVADDFNLAN